MVANEGGEGVTVHPTPFNQETVLDSAKKYIEQVNSNRNFIRMILTV